MLRQLTLGGAIALSFCTLAVAANAELPPTAIQQFADSHTQAALELLNVTYTEQFGREMADVYYQLPGMGPGRTRAEGRELARLQTVLREEFVAEMGNYRAMLAPYYAKHFSEQELRRLTALLNRRSFHKYASEKGSVGAETLAAVSNSISSGTSKEPKGAFGTEKNYRLDAARQFVKTQNALRGPNAYDRSVDEYEATAYARHFTEQELRELIQINISPLYRRYTAQEEVILKEASPAPGQIDPFKRALANASVRFKKEPH